MFASWIWIELLSIVYLTHLKPGTCVGRNTQVSGLGIESIWQKENDVHNQHIAICSHTKFHQARLNTFWVRSESICFCKQFDYLCYHSNHNFYATTLKLEKTSKNKQKQKPALLAHCHLCTYISSIKLAWTVFELSRNPHVFATFWLFPLP